MPASRPALWERAFPGDDSAQEMLRLAQGLVDGSEDTDVSARRAFWLWYLMRRSRLSLPADPAPETLAQPDRQASTSLTDPPTVGPHPPDSTPTDSHPMDSNTTSLSAPSPGARGPHDPPRCLPDTQESANQRRSSLRKGD